MSPHRLRTLACVSIVAGLLLAGGYAWYAGRESALRFEQWYQVERNSYDVGRLRHALRLLERGLPPPATVVPAWPGLAGGGGLAVTGLLLLAVAERRRAALALRPRPLSAALGERRNRAA